MTTSTPVGLTAEQETFRRELRDFLAGADVRREVAEIAAYPPRHEASHLAVYRRLGERGWLAPSWPERFGGLGLGAVEAALVTEELTLAGIPDDVHVLSIDIVGMFLLRAGTEAQQQRHLPHLARGERIATVLFTEPGCGSDLSALSTAARRDGDGWRLRGGKIYNQKSQFGDVALCAARTTAGPVALHGITLFLVPLRSPAVHIEPVPSMGNDRFNLVVLDDLRVGPEDVVGQVDDGWRLLNDLLQLERTGIDFHGKGRRLLDAAIGRATATGRIDDPSWAGDLAELDAAQHAAHALAWEQVHALADGRPDPVRSAMSKWFASERISPVLAAGADLDGLATALSAWDGGAPDDGLWEAATRTGPAHRLASGTSEVMLYLVAGNGLGLL
ncbi:acyl-CoA dehydrogenase family protein [Actinoplanes sp. NPDC051859]|uniref:acyl-CoA dehydrogenase family protein n=1 Tax=Actinoplanes sp. NPDC051859 TaxID=3363909 RepID=UPI0037B5D91D